MEREQPEGLVQGLLALARLAGATTALWWRDLPVLVQVLIGLMALDIATGLLTGFATQTLSSEVSFRGMAKKATVLLLVAGAAWLEPAVQLPVAQAVAGFYAAHEGLSLVENAARLGLPVPAALRAALVKLTPPPAAGSPTAGPPAAAGPPPSEERR